MYYKMECEMKQGKWPIMIILWKWFLFQSNTARAFRALDYFSLSLKLCFYCHQSRQIVDCEFFPISIHCFAVCWCWYHCTQWSSWLLLGLFFILVISCHPTLLCHSCHYCAQGSVGWLCCLHWKTISPLSVVTTVVFHVDNAEITAVQ